MRKSNLTFLFASVACIFGPISAAQADTNVAATDTAQPAIVVTGQQGKIDTGVFVKLPNMRTPRLSNDGSRIAYMMSDKGKRVLVIQDIVSAGAKPVVVMVGDDARESGDRTIQSYRWVGANNLVVTIAMREDLGSGPGDFGRLVSYNIATKKLTQLAWDGAGGDATNILSINHDKDEILLSRTSTKGSNERSNLPEVVKVDVNSGKYVVEQPVNPEVSRWIADHNGVIRMGTGYSGQTGKFKYLYRSNEKETLKTVLSATADRTGGQPDPQIFIPGTDEAWAVSRKDGFDKAYKLNMKTMELSAPIFETPNFDISGIIPNKDRNGVDGYIAFNGDEKYVFTDPLMQEIQAFSEELFGKNEVVISDVSKDQSKAIILAGRKKKNPGFYLYDLKAGKIRLLNWFNVELKDVPRNKTVAEWYTASDGQKIQAVVTYPRHRTGKNLPVVMMPHGGPFGVTSGTAEILSWSQALAEAGYVVIEPNYRGSGGFGKAFEEAGRKPDGYGFRMQDDLNDAIKWFGDKGVIDPKRACIMGWSYGGYAAARGAERDADKWRCAIAGAGVYDLPMMHRWDEKRAGKFSRGFQETAADPAASSPAQFTDKPWSPILIVSAVRDARIPLEQSRTLVSRLKSSGKVEGTDFKYIEQPQGTHNLPYDDVHMQWIEEAEAWLARFNPAYVASDTDKAPPKMTAAKTVASK
jgi:dipeptidyl aminopeptidase/acylaminoacyl peptidase